MTYTFAFGNDSVNIHTTQTTDRKSAVICLHLLAKRFKYVGIGVSSNRGRQILVDLTQRRSVWYPIPEE